MPVDQLAGLPYPAGTDPDNVPQDLKELAEAVARHCVLQFNSAAARDAAFTAARLSPEAGMVAWADGVLAVYDGSAWRRVPADDHDHLGPGSGARLGLLGSGGSGVDVVDSTTAFVSCFSVPVTIPPLDPGQRVVVEAHARVGVSVVGNVVAGIFRDGVAVPGNQGRVPNPTVTTQYETSLWGIEGGGAGGVATPPPPGDYVYSLRFRNLAAGSWTFGEGDMTVSVA